MPYTITSREVERSITAATLAAMELSHCDLSTQAKAELCYQASDAIEAYLNMLIDSGYTAVPVHAISHVINCANCRAYESARNPECAGMCDVHSINVYDFDFCSEWKPLEEHGRG